MEKAICGYFFPLFFTISTVNMTNSRCWEMIGIMRGDQLPNLLASHLPTDDHWLPKLRNPSQVASEQRST